MSGAPGTFSCVVPEPPTIEGPSTACNSLTLTATTGANGKGVRWADGSSGASLTLTASTTTYAVSTTPESCESKPTPKAVSIYKPGSYNESSSPCGCNAPLTACDDGICKNTCPKYFTCTGTCGNNCCVKEGGRPINSSTECSAWALTYNLNGGAHALLTTCPYDGGSMPTCDKYGNWSSYKWSGSWVLLETNNACVR
jgi:hypothetical protein